MTARICRVHDADDVIPGRICGRGLPCRDHAVRTAQDLTGVDLKRLGYRLENRSLKWYRHAGVRVVLDGADGVFVYVSTDDRAQLHLWAMSFEGSAPAAVVLGAIQLAGGK